MIPRLAAVILFTFTSFHDEHLLIQEKEEKKYFKNEKRKIMNEMNNRKIW